MLAYLDDINAAYIYIYVISLSCDLRHQKDIRPYKSNTCNATVFGQQDNEATNWR